MSISLSEAFISNRAVESASSSDYLNGALQALRRVGELRFHQIYEKQLSERTGGWILRSSFSPEGDRRIQQELNERRERTLLSAKALAKAIIPILIWGKSDPMVIQLTKRATHLLKKCKKPKGLVPSIVGTVQPADLNNILGVTDWEQHEKKAEALAGLRELSFFIHTYPKNEKAQEIKPLVRERIKELRKLIDQIDAKKIDDMDQSVQYRCLRDAAENRLVEIYSDLS